MILPETTPEREYTYAVAAMTLRARAQDSAGDTEGAIVLSQAVRDLEANGKTLYGARNAGLLEFSLTLANEDEKPPLFLDFLAQQEERLAAAKAAKRDAAAPEPEPAPIAQTVAETGVEKGSKNPEPQPEPVKKPTRRRTVKKES